MTLAFVLVGIKLSLSVQLLTNGHLTVTLCRLLRIIIIINAVKMARDCTMLNLIAKEWCN